MQLQIVRFLGLILLLLVPSQSNPVPVQCAEDISCSSLLNKFYAQLINLPPRINERSIAPWSYVMNSDFNRQPQNIYEANCQTSHSCRGIKDSLSAESIPVSIRVPFLRENPSCLTYAVEFEDIKIACICAESRKS